MSLERSNITAYFITQFQVHVFRALYHYLQVGLGSKSKNQNI